MNYFTNTNVRWKTWSPENVIFKSNQLVKKVLPSEHILSWKSKGDRDRKMCEMTGWQSSSNKSIWWTTIYILYQRKLQRNYGSIKRCKR